MLFDRLVLLCAGRVVYSGLVKDATAYFTSSSLGYPARPRQNPAEYVIDIAGGKILPIGAEKTRSDIELETLFKVSGLMTPPASMISNSPLEFGFVRMSIKSKANQVGMLVHRGLKSALRDKTNLSYTMAKNVWLGILIGAVFHNVAHKLDEPFYDSDGLQTSDTSEFAGVLYFLLVYIWLSNGQIIPQCVEASKLYWREIESFAYVPSSYWVAIVGIELPFLLLFHTIFSTLVYLMCGFPNSASYYFYFWIVLGLANLFAMLFAQFLAFSTGSSLLAFAIYPVVFYVLGMFSSFTIRIDKLAPGFQWVSEITFVRWAFQGLMVLEFDRHSTAGEVVLQEYSFDEQSKGFCALIVLVNAAVAFILLYLSLRKPAKKIVYLELDGWQEHSGNTFNLEQSLLDSANPDSTFRHSSRGSGLDASARKPTLRESLVGAVSVAENILHVVAENLELVESVPHGSNLIASNNIVK